MCSENKKGTFAGLSLVLLVLWAGGCGLITDPDGGSDDSDENDIYECDPENPADFLPARIRLSADGLRLVTGLGSPTDFYDLSKIRTIRLTFSQSDWWTQLTNNYQTEKELAAEMSYDGTTLPAAVGVRFKGFTSYVQNRTQKKSFNISVDYEDAAQDIDGFQNLNLNCAFDDDAFMREVLYEHISQLYAPAVCNNYVELYLNDEYWGLYISSQQIDTDFVEEWFPSTNGSRWRAEPSAGGGGPGFGQGTSGLNYLGSAISAYTPYYTLKRSCVSDPWSDLVEVCDVLANTSSSALEEAVSEVLDLDRTLWFLALENVFTDEDSYINKGGTDYYLYRDFTSGLMTPIEYDGNSTLMASYVSWSPFRNANNAAFPLLYRLLNVPAIRQRYLAHVRTILEESFNTIDMTALIDAYAAMISPYISADPKKMMTYAEFLSAVSNLKTIVATRANYLNSNGEIAAQGLTVSGVQWSVGGTAWAAPGSSDAVTIKATVSGSMGVQAVYVYVGEGVVGRFTRYELSDDGAHGDGAEGDGVFGLILPARAAGTRVRFYVEAVAANTAGTRTYGPAGAAHDVFTWKVGF